MDRITALSRGTQIMLISAVLLLILSFFAWQEVSVEVAGVEAISAEANAWEDFWGVVMGLATIALIAWIGLQLANVKMPIDVPDRTVTLGLAAVILVFAILKNLINDYSTFISYIGVLAAIGVAVGAWLRSQEEEYTPQTRIDTPTPAS
jgi:hypothetical protein